MREKDLIDFNAYLDELKRESDRGLVLVGTSFIDEKLKLTLISFCIDSKSTNRLINEFNSPLGTFSSRVDACLALGLIDEFEHHEISILRKIRNELAHGLHGMTYEDVKIKGLISSLSSDLPIENDGLKFESRFKILNSFICIISRLYYRPEYVIEEKRTTKNWAGDLGKWIAMKDEKPKKGQIVIAVGKTKDKSM